MATDAEVLAAYRQTGGALKRRPGACQVGCSLWELRGTRAFVCRDHGAVHRCGWDCDRRVSTNSDDVCMLTGHVVRGPAEEHHWQKPGDSGRALQTHLGCRQHAPSAATTAAARMAVHVLRACRLLLLSSPARTESKAVYRRRALSATKRAVRTSATNAAWGAAVIAAHRAAPAMRPPCPSDALVQTLATRIAQFACALGVPANKRAAAAFAAATVQMLSTGHFSRGVCVVPRLPALAVHAPSELQHADLLPITCRAVSTATRTIVEACNAGTVRFPLTRWQDRRAQPTAK